MDINFKGLKQNFINSEKRFLGIDYGNVNIGFAISDVGRMIASPLVVIKNNGWGGLKLEVQKIIDEYDIGLVVIGNPLLLSGREGEMSDKIHKFKDWVVESFPGLEIVLFDERLSSSMSERMLVNQFDMSRKKRAAVIDKISAAIILQGFLDI